MIILFILTAAFIAFGLYNWFFILKAMDRATFRRTMVKSIVCVVIAVTILGFLMLFNSVSGI